MGEIWGGEVRGEEPRGAERVPSNPNPTPNPTPTPNPNPTPNANPNSNPNPKQVRSALLRSNSGLSWGSGSSPAGSLAGSQSRLPADAMAAALDRVSQAALAATRLKEGGRIAQERSQSKRSGSLKRQGQAGRSKGNQWSTATHSAEDSTAMSQSGLLSQVVSWGRTDIVRQVPTLWLANPDPDPNPNPDPDPDPDPEPESIPNPNPNPDPNPKP